MSKILHPGPPLLTVEAADAAIDYIDFMAATVRGVDLIDVTSKARREWRSYLASHYDSLAPTDRFWFANAAAQWATIQGTWQHYPPQMQEMLRQQWAVGLDAVLAFVDPVIDTGREASPVQPGGYNLYNAQPSSRTGWYGASQGGFGDAGQRGGGAYDDLLRTILANQARQEQEAAQRSPEEQMQVRSQNNAINAQMLSNISRMGFETSMAIVRNFK